MKTLYLLLIGISLTNCVATKSTSYNSIKKGVHYVLEDISNRSETNMKYVIYDSIFFKKSDILEKNNYILDLELANLWQKALSEVLGENKRYDHSNNIRECNVILQNPKSDLGYSRLFIDVWIKNDEFLRYLIQSNNSKLEFKRIKHYFKHIEGEKLIDPDSTISAPILNADKIDSLPIKNIFDLRYKK